MTSKLNDLCLNDKQIDVPENALPENDRRRMHTKPDPTVTPRAAAAAAAATAGTA